MQKLRCCGWLSLLLTLGSVSLSAQQRPFVMFQIGGGFWDDTIKLTDLPSGIQAVQFVTTPTVCSSGQAPRGVDVAGNATGCQSVGAAARSQSPATRSLNSCFQVSSTRDALIHYSVDVGTSLSLTGGTVGTVTLTSYSDSACTLSAQPLSQFTNGNTGALTIGLALTQTMTGLMTGYLPAGSYVKINTANTTGTPSFTYRVGQEVLL